MKNTTNNFKMFALLTQWQIICALVAYFCISNIYFLTLVCLTIYWVGYYWWEASTDFATKRMIQVYQESREWKPLPPELDSRLDHYRYAWHDYDMFEKINTLIVTTVAVAVITQDIWFASLILLWSSAFRWLLHEGFSSIIAKIPFWHIGSGNWLDDLLRKLKFGPVGISLIFSLPTIVTYLIAILYIVYFT